jgi:uncharacterized protein YndB with AHSA1/START domain
MRTMTVIDTAHDVDALTMTFTAEFDAPLDRVWRIWEDPRQLERWWGPPTWPATFTRHEPRPGGRTDYFMTGPDGDRAHGFWNVLTVDAPTGMSFEDGFSDGDGNPDPSMPTTTTTVTLTDLGGRTRMEVLSRFASVEQLEQLLAMGMREGMTEAIGQIDALLAA